MKTFIYFSLPAHGHTNPTLPVIKELVATGNNVIYYSLPEFKEKIEQTGATFRSYPRAMEVDSRLSKNISLFAYAISKITAQATEDLIKEVAKDKPDCIVYDSFALWAKTTSSALGIPAVTFYTTLAFNEKVIRQFFSFYVLILAAGFPYHHKLVQGYFLYRRLAKKYHFKAKSLNESIFNTEKLNIVFTSSYFQPLAQSFGKTFQYVGPSIRSRSENIDFLKKIPKNKKVLYISVGTIFNDNLQFFKDCIKAFGSTEYQVILSLGHRFKVSDLGEIPQNFIVKNSVPQLEVLQRTDVFISHGGMNSVNESLYYGVPMILIPQMTEQYMNSYIVTKLGAGTLMRANAVTPQKLLKSANQVIQDASFKSSAQKIQKTLHAAGGFKKASQLLLQFVGA